MSADLSNRHVSHEVRDLLERIGQRQAMVAIVGQGFVGIPQAMACVRAGYRVVGFDRDEERVASLNRGRSPGPDTSDEEISGAFSAGRYRATSDDAVLAEADVVLICVPTPLTPDRDPDLTAIRNAASAIASRVRRPRLIVLESTVPAGTTRSVVLPLLEARGDRVGHDCFLGFAPERIDPGNTRFTTENLPRLVSGITADCRLLSEAFYRTVVESVIVVAAPEIAELAKAVENTFRFVNISFANEVAMLCDRLGYSVWDVIDAAATKPFAFMAHYPGPGVGGSCIPVVPHYLRHVSEEARVGSRLIDAAAAINDEMPGFVVAKLGRLLDERGVGLAGARILVVGVSYKPDVADTRESPAIPVIRLLRATKAAVNYHDPLIPSLVVDGVGLSSATLTEAALAATDAVLLLTLHSTIDRERLIRGARLLFDTRNALRATESSNVVVL